jgi:hypothetical protein
MWNNGSHERDFGSFAATKRKEAKLLRLPHIFGYKLKPNREIWRFLIKNLKKSGYLKTF